MTWAKAADVLEHYMFAIAYRGNEDDKAKLLEELHTEFIRNIISEKSRL
jgi:hypothetical protein